MFNPRAYENTRPDGIGVMEIKGAGGGEKDPRLFVPLKRSELRGEIRGPLAALELVQVYGYTRQQCDKVVEASYRFPLPGDAAVTRVRVRFGDAEIIAELKERQQAEAEYEQAKNDGKQAALATRESPDVFTLQVTGLQPDQDVTVETSYVQLARNDGAGWSLRIPLTTGPRYFRSDELTSRHARGQPLALLRDPGHRFRLDLMVRGAREVQSPTHALRTATQDEAIRVELRDGEIIPDRDCILSWRPGQPTASRALHVLVEADVATTRDYFLALVVPPDSPEALPGAGAEALPTVPREVILLVDHSGSMEGAKWAAANWAVKRFLSGLSSVDSFALGVFHNTTRWFSDRAQRAEKGVVQEAVKFLESARDSGGTELGVALEQALNLDRSPGGPTRHVLVVTDAQVTDQGRILRLADEEGTRPDRRRIHVLCIDAAPNSFLALSLAERGGGVAHFLTSAPEEEDITTALDQILADWSAPVYADLSLELNRAGVETSGRACRSLGDSGGSAIDLGDLPAGRPLWVAGRAPRVEGQPLHMRLIARGKDSLGQATVGVESRDAGPWALKALFGARKVVGLEFLISSGYEKDELADALRRLGYDPAVVLLPGGRGRRKVYAENARADAELALKKLLIAEALDYGLASSETAFVAVRKEAGRPIEGHIAVGNALPAGWSEHFVSSAPTTLASMAFSIAPTRSRGLPSGAGASMGLPRFAAHTEGARVPAAQEAIVFAGVPQFAQGRVVLIDTSLRQDAGRLPDDATISGLRLGFPEGAPDAAAVDAGLCLWVFLDDLVAPRARVSLSDLLAQGLQRPLNLARRRGQVLRIVLVDPNGSWSRRAPRIEIMLQWQGGMTSQS